MIKNRYTLSLIVSLTVCALITCSLFCCPVFAGTQSDDFTVSRTVTYYGDGSRDETIMILETSERGGTITAYVDRDHYSSSNEHVWRVRLTGTFTYNGTTSSCTAASTACTFYKSGWSVMSEHTNHTGSTASNAVLLGKKIAGVTLPVTEVNLTLTCDKDGHLS